MTNVQVNKKILYFELSIKPNVGIFGSTVSMWEKITLKPSSLLMMLLIFNIELARDLCL